ncbi:MAG: hypothetical protein PHW69_09460 [Elusimicrobiaceae bacterium]|nr:hypothetical protein [Elusimicrobiaceae bacterium]
MSNVFDTVLLLALPASGKSEVRRFLDLQTPDACRKDFHMGPTVQLDDFPYVHLMRRVDDELEKLGHRRLFFASGAKPFIDPIDWGTLIELINEDYADLHSAKIEQPASAARHLMDRIERAGKKVGAPARLAGLDEAVAKTVAAAIEEEAAQLLKDKHNAYQPLEGKTKVIEFARGGAHGSAMPLEKPFGYQYSLGCLSEEILSRSVILYIWVTPEESRRKNQARSNPADPGSILHHGVPIEVMMNDYGCDDMDWLERNTAKAGTVTVKAHGKTFHLPIARFDNRVDKTSFLRADQKEWDAKAEADVRSAIKAAMDKLASFSS